MKLVLDTREDIHNSSSTYGVECPATCTFFEEFLFFIPNDASSSLDDQHFSMWHPGVEKGTDFGASSQGVWFSDVIHVTTSSSE